MERYICIHGHFYQPPEKTMLDSTEMEDSAYPYHDWNERITAECYAPTPCHAFWTRQAYYRNREQLQQDQFQLWPTLLTWLEKKGERRLPSHPGCGQRKPEHLLRHGSALAQAYNHMILPLAVSRDKYTQILWA